MPLHSNPARLLGAYQVKRNTAVLGEKASSKIEKIAKKDGKIEVLELDELCVHKKI